MQIIIDQRQSDLPLSSKQIEVMSLHVLKNLLDISCDQLILNFVSAEEIKQLHLDYFDDDSLTDCISFPIDDQDDQSYPMILGELFICPQAALEYCDSEKHLDPYDEISLYVVHGILHLLDYDDIDPKDREMMRAKEKEIIDELARSNLLLSTPQKNLDAN